MDATAEKMNPKSFISDVLSGKGKKKDKEVKVRKVGKTSPTEKSRMRNRRVAKADDAAEAPKTEKKTRKPKTTAKAEKPARKPRGEKKAKAATGSAPTVADAIAGTVERPTKLVANDPNSAAHHLLYAGQAELKKYANPNGVKKAVASAIKDTFGITAPKAELDNLVAAMTPAIAGTVKKGMTAAIKAIKAQAKTEEGATKEDIEAQLDVVFADDEE